MVSETKIKVDKELKDICVALHIFVTCLPGSWDKRFIKGLGSAEYLTEKQVEWVYRLAQKYRRQIPSVYKKYKRQILSKSILTPLHPAITHINADVRIYESYEDFMAGLNSRPSYNGVSKEEVKAEEAFDYKTNAKLLLAEMYKKRGYTKDNYEEKFDNEIMLEFFEIALKKAFMAGRSSQQESVNQKTREGAFEKAYEIIYDYLEQFIKKDIQVRDMVSYLVDELRNSGYIITPNIN